MEAAEESVQKISDDTFNVAVKEKAERGRANTRVLALIRAYYGGKAKDIRIVSGHHSPHKILSVEGV